MEEFASIYWAAACIVLWAGSGVTDGQLADAVNLTCDMSGLTVPQEAVFKETINKLMKGERDGTD